jgi:hypothetical protein
LAFIDAKLKKDAYLRMTVRINQSDKKTGEEGCSSPAKSG